jgi:hypothetical protein
MKPDLNRQICTGDVDILMNEFVESLEASLQASGQWMQNCQQMQCFPFIV